MFFCSVNKAKWYLIIGAPLLMVLISCLIPASKPSKMRIGQMRSEHQLRVISELVLEYKNAHGGNSPRRFSELISDDRPEELKKFKAPNKVQVGIPDGWATNKALIDLDSDYELCHNPGLGIIAFEKPGLWPDGSVAVCFTNLERCSVLTVTQSETGTEEHVVDEYQLKVERYKISFFKKLFNPMKGENKNRQ